MKLIRTVLAAGAIALTGGFVLAQAATRPASIDKLNIINGFYVHIPDLGQHIEITPERKKLVDETIWEVVNGHPYTQVKE